MVVWLGPINLALYSLSLYSVCKLDADVLADLLLRGVSLLRHRVRLQRDLALERPLGAPGYAEADLQLHDERLHLHRLVHPAAGHKVVQRFALLAARQGILFRHRQRLLEDHDGVTAQAESLVLASPSRRLPDGRPQLDNRLCLPLVSPPESVNLT